MTIPDALQLALEHHQAGRLAEAEGIYRQILAVEPRQAEALHLQGVLAHQIGRNDVAVDLIGKAIAVKPVVPAFHCNLGEAHRILGNLDAAIAAYRRALDLKPDFAPAYHNLGMALAAQGRSNEAIAAYRRALEFKPDYVDAHNNLGLALREQGRTEEALAAYRQALQIQPDYAEVQNNMGLVFSEQSHLNEAIVMYRRALHLKPGMAETHYNLGNALMLDGQLDKAVEAFERAIEVRPEFAEAYCNLSGALTNLGLLDKAFAACQRAIRLRPDSPQAHNNTGNVLTAKGRIDEAMSAYRRALELKPDFADAHNNLGSAFMEQWRVDEAVEACRAALKFKPDFAEGHGNLGTALRAQGLTEEAIAEYRLALKYKPDYVAARTNLLLCLHYPGNLDAGMIFEEHRRWDAIHARPLAKLIEPHRNDPDPERRLRIGYVTPDFREHAVAFFMEKLLANHDAAQVEVFCYAEALAEDAVTRRLGRHVAQWRKTTGMPDAQVAELIRRDGIDILVDLAAHTRHNRLLVFARKPAPVQVTYLGYPDTTGMSVLDYRFTDTHADPPGMTEHLHTEQLIRLPDCNWCFQAPEGSPEVGFLPVLQSGYITFGGFNSLPKITGQMLGLWSEILLQLPGSHLLLKNPGFLSRSAQTWVRGVLEKSGVAPERVELVGDVPTRAAHLGFYNRIDIALDTYPYHGTTTTCEALWMGVPVVTLAGKTHASRVGVSLLSNVGVPELVAQSAGEYVRIAVELGKDVDRLEKMRGAMRGQMAASPLMDGPRFARNVEEAYRQMWRAWCVKQSPPQTS